jgi:hypothetical protein
MLVQSRVDYPAMNLTYADLDWIRRRRHVNLNECSFMCSDEFVGDNSQVRLVSGR